MDPGLAGITAYVSQDCTGMKDEPVDDKTGYLAQHNWPLFFHHLSAAAAAAESGDMSLTVSIPRQTHPFQIYDHPHQPLLNLSDLCFDSCLSSQ